MFAEKHNVKPLITSAGAKKAKFRQLHTYCEVGLINDYHYVFMEEIQTATFCTEVFVTLGRFSNLNILESSLYMFPLRGIGRV